MNTDLMPSSQENSQHPWNVSVAEARDIQNRLRHKVRLSDTFNSVKFIGGADVGFEDKGRLTRAAVAVLSFPELELIEYNIIRRKTEFPYIPGYLSFREAPALIAAIEELVQWPDLLICDGQGIAHPRRLGIASHIGVLTGLPTIGVGKTRLIGEHPPLPQEKGSHMPLTENGEVIGKVVRTRTAVKPVYVSAGHKICLETAVFYVLACVTRYRLPETIRWAHRLASGK